MAQLDRDMGGRPQKPARPCPCISVCHSRFVLFFLPKTTELGAPSMAQLDRDMGGRPQKPAPFSPLHFCLSFPLRFVLSSQTTELGAPSMAQLDRDMGGRPQKPSPFLPLLFCLSFPSGNLLPCNSLHRGINRNCSIAIFAPKIDRSSAGKNTTVIWSNCGIPRRCGMR
jgi:hypothetical protein